MAPINHPAQTTSPPIRSFKKSMLSMAGSSASQQLPASRARKANNPPSCTSPYISTQTNKTAIAALSGSQHESYKSVKSTNLQSPSTSRSSKVGGTAGTAKNNSATQQHHHQHSQHQLVISPHDQYKNPQTENRRQNAKSLVTAGN